MNGKYQFYVLIEYPIGNANQALLNQIKQDEVNENYGRMQSGLTWFQKNNIDAYYKLLD